MEKMYSRMLLLMLGLSVAHGGPQICSVCRCSTPLVYLDCSGLGLTEVPDLDGVPEDTLIDLRENPIGAGTLEKWSLNSDRDVENVYWDVTPTSATVNPQDRKASTSTGTF